MSVTCGGGGNVGRWAGWCSSLDDRASLLGSKQRFPTSPLTDWTRSSAPDALARVSYRLCRVDALPLRASFFFSVFRSQLLVFWMVTIVASWLVVVRRSCVSIHEFMYKRGTSRHTWHSTLRALGVAAMQPGGRLDVQEHTRNARSRSLV